MKGRQEPWKSVEGMILKIQQEMNDNVAAKMKQPWK